MTAVSTIELSYDIRADELMPSSCTLKYILRNQAVDEARPDPLLRRPSSLRYCRRQALSIPCAIAPPWSSYGFTYGSHHHRCASMRLATRTRCFEGRLRQRQRLAMGGCCLIHEPSEPQCCLAMQMPAAPCRVCMAEPHSMDGMRMPGPGSRHAAERAKFARSRGAVRVFVLSCSCCS